MMAYMADRPRSVCHVSGMQLLKIRSLYAWHLTCLRVATYAAASLRCSVHTLVRQAEAQRSILHGMEQRLIRRADSG